MTNSIPLRPIKKLTVMIDACVYRHNPAVGEQLAAILAPLKKAGVDCHLLQDRFCLMETTTYGHELMLSEDREALRKQDAGIASKKHSRHIAPRVESYLRVTEDIGEHAAIHYMDSPEQKQLCEERAALTRQFLFGDPRLREEWPDMREAIIGKRLGKRLKPDDLDEYHHSLFTACSQCAYVINGIHERMRHDKAFKQSLSEQDKKDFMLDKFREGREVHFSDIDLLKIDHDHIPKILAEVFCKTETILNLCGKSRELTPIGQGMVDSHAHWGEKVMENHARDIMANNTVEPPSQNVVLLITDDGKALKDLKQLHKDHPGCTPISSRELATELVALAGMPAMQEYFPAKLVEQARDISRGYIQVDSPRALPADQIMSGDTSFVNRLYVTSTLPPEVLSRIK